MKTQRQTSTQPASYKRECILVCRNQFCFSLLFVSVVLHPLQASSQLVNKPRVETVVFPQLKVFSMLKQKQGTEKAGGLW